MNTHRSNASVVAVLVILLVIAGVIYLFWQNQQAIPLQGGAAEEATVVEEATPAEAPAEPAAEAETSVEAEAEVEVSTESN